VNDVILNDLETNVPHPAARFVPREEEAISMSLSTGQETTQAEREVAASTIHALRHTCEVLLGQIAAGRRRTLQLQHDLTAAQRREAHAREQLESLSFNGEPSYDRPDQEMFCRHPVLRRSRQTLSTIIEGHGEATGRDFQYIGLSEQTLAVHSVLQKVDHAHRLLKSACRLE